MSSDEQPTRESFLMYRSFYGPVKGLTDEELGKLFRMVFEYHDGNEPTDECPVSVRMAFEFFRNQFRVDERKYRDKVVKNRESARMRWHKGNANDANASERMPMDANDADNDNEYDNGNGNDNGNGKAQAEAPRRAPTRDEFIASLAPDTRELWSYWEKTFSEITTSLEDNRAALNKILEIEREMPRAKRYVDLVDKVWGEKYAPKEAKASSPVQAWKNRQTIKAWAKANFNQQPKF